MIYAPYITLNSLVYSLAIKFFNQLADALFGIA